MGYREAATIIVTTAAAAGCATGAIVRTTPAPRAASGARSAAIDEGQHDPVRGCPSDSTPWEWLLGGQATAEIHARQDALWPRVARCFDTVAAQRAGVAPEVRRQMVLGVASHRPFTLLLGRQGEVTWTSEDEPIYGALSRCLSAAARRYVQQVGPLTADRVCVRFPMNGRSWLTP